MAFGSKDVEPVEGGRWTLRDGLGNTLEVAKALVEEIAYIVGLM